MTASLVSKNQKKIKAEEIKAMAWVISRKQIDSEIAKDPSKGTFDPSKQASVEEMEARYSKREKELLLMASSNPKAWGKIVSFYFKDISGYVASSDILPNNVKELLKNHQLITKAGTVSGSASAILGSEYRKKAEFVSYNDLGLNTSDYKTKQSFKQKIISTALGGTLDPNSFLTSKENKLEKIDKGEFMTNEAARLAMMSKARQTKTNLDAGYDVTREERREMELINKLTKDYREHGGRTGLLSTLGHSLSISKGISDKSKAIGGVGGAMYGIGAYGASKLAGGLGFLLRGSGKALKAGAEIGLDKALSGMQSINRTVHGETAEEASARQARERAEISETRAAEKAANLEAEKKKKESIESKASGFEPIKEDATGGARWVMPGSTNSTEAEANDREEDKKTQHDATFQKKELDLLAKIEKNTSNKSSGLLVAAIAGIVGFFTSVKSFFSGLMAKLSQWAVLAGLKRATPTINLPGSDIPGVPDGIEEKKKKESGSSKDRRAARRAAERAAAQKAASIEIPTVETPTAKAPTGVETTDSTGAAKGVGKYGKMIKGLGVLSAGVGIYSAIQTENDASLTRQEKNVEHGNSAGSVAGSVLGGLVGAVGGPLGIAVGSVVGGVVGSFVGDVGDKIGKGMSALVLGDEVEQANMKAETEKAKVKQYWEEKRKKDAEALSAKTKTVEETKQQKEANTLATAVSQTNVNQVATTAAPTNSQNSSTQLMNPTCGISSYIELLKDRQLCMG